MAAIAKLFGGGKAAAKDGDAAREEFMAVYAELRDELVADDFLGDAPPAARDWLREMLDYNVPLGKLNRGMAVAEVLDACAASRDGAPPPAPADRKRAHVLGWCIELLQAFFLVADDIMDHSVTRRGQPCWFRVPRVGMVAVNDAILLEAAIYRLLARRFGGDPALHLALSELFHETTYQTAHGQLLDVTTTPPGAAVDLGRYTPAAWERIVTYKTAFYTFYLPVACGLRLAGVADPAAYALAKALSVDMGRYFQAQDDVLDCFADAAVIGKVGTDIEDAKCSWLVVQAMAAASPAQKAAIEANYGKADPAAVAAVKAVYAELGLEAAFARYEAESYAALTAAIEGQTLLPKAVFTQLLAKIYKRKK